MQRALPSMRPTRTQLPDLNAETLPFDEVQSLLDEAAYFNLYSIPDSEYGRKTSTNPTTPSDYFGYNGVFGFAVAGSLHRLRSNIVRSSGDFSCEQSLSHQVGSYSGRLLVSNLPIEWSVDGDDPAPAMFDPWVSQYVTLKDSKVNLGRDEYLSVYGVGRTYPANVEGSPTAMVGLVANTIGGTGDALGIQATVVLLGFINADLGFEGNVSIRIADPSRMFHAESVRPDTLLDYTPPWPLLTMRGNKANSRVRTSYGIPPDPQRVTLAVPAAIYGVDYPVGAGGYERWKSQMAIGQHIGELNAEIYTDILAPLGEQGKPLPFETRNTYQFLDQNGREFGTVTAEVQYGQSWALRIPAAPEQGAMRYGGVGPIVEGTGAFIGTQGMVAVNSAVGLAPHALSLQNVLHMLPPKSQVDIGRARIPSPYSQSRPRRKKTKSAIPDSTGLPDLNVGVYPFKKVQQLIDRGRHLSLFSSATAGATEPIRSQTGAVAGFCSANPIHRFQSSLDVSGQQPSLRVTNISAESVGILQHRFAIVPDHYEPRPGRTPPFVQFDPLKSQRFVITDAVCSFGKGRHEIRGFGTGRTFPDGNANGCVPLVGVATMVDAVGCFSGAEGTLTINGSFCPRNGLRANVFCRVVDDKPRMNTGMKLPKRTVTRRFPDDGATYIVFRGQKKDETQETQYIFDSKGRPEGFKLRGEMRQFLSDTHLAHPASEVTSRSQVGAVLGEFSSAVLIDVTDLGGSGGNAPTVFRDYDEFKFKNDAGDVLGSFAFDGGAGKRITGQPSAAVGEGESFNLLISETPSLQALRVCGYGPIVRGKGIFEGVSGLVSYNALVTVAPHVLEFVFVARINDPEGRFHTTM